MCSKVSIRCRVCKNPPSSCILSGIPQERKSERVSQHLNGKITKVGQVLDLPGPQYHEAIEVITDIPTERISERMFGSIIEEIG